MLQPGFLLQRCSCYICSLAILRRYATMFHGFWLLSKAIGGKSNMAKRTISILALILTFLAATAAVAETWYIQTDNGKPLNIRSGPSKTSGIVATAENGIPLEVVELLEDGSLKISRGLGFYSKMDLGIVKYHFELGSGKKIF